MLYRISFVAFFVLLLGLAAVISPAAADEQYWDFAPTPTPLPQLPAADILNVAGDSCETGTLLDFTYGQPLLKGGTTNVNSFLQNSSDPDISACMSATGSPPSAQGFRSAWYVVENYDKDTGSQPIPGTGIRGTLRVTVMPNNDYRQNYDTVVAIHTGTCAVLTRLTCNDDAVGLLSVAETQIYDGGKYYIEIVDRSAAPPSTATLNIQIEIIPDAEWETETLLSQSVSRHAVVTQGHLVYIIGGQTAAAPTLGGAAGRTPNVYRYDTSNQQITELAPMDQAGPTVDGAGYSNADAVIVNNRIHLPTGHIGADSPYDGTHWVYDITSNSWQAYSAAGGQIDPPWGSGVNSNVPGWAELVELDDGFRKGFYMTGGLRGPFLSNPANSQPNGILYEYTESPVGNGDTFYQWRNLPSLIKPRYAHTAAKLGNLVCVAGGLTVESDEDSSQYVVLSNSECFNPNGLPEPTWAEIAPLRIPRFLAGSAVGPDGNWYVFGGLSVGANSQLVYVGTIEVYNPTTNSWGSLSANYALNTPAYAWLRGAFIGNKLWLFGGQQQGNNVPVPIVQTHVFPFNAGWGPNPIFLPFLTRPMIYDGTTLYDSIGLPPNTVIPYAFSQPGEAFHVFYFWKTAAGPTDLNLGNIPAGSDYDLLLYDANKTLRGLSQNLGTANENILMNLAAGQYYAIVVRVQPPLSQPPNSSPYFISVGQ